MVEVIVVVVAMQGSPLLIELQKINSWLLSTERLVQTDNVLVTDSFAYQTYGRKDDQ